MRRYKYYILSLLAVAGYAVYAADNDGRTEKPEKVKPSQELLKSSAARISPAYTPFRLSGSEDGIPYGLNAKVSDKNVALSWISPEPTDGYFEDFEGHADFAINSPGNIGWSYIDADNKYTYTWAACTFTNMGQKMAFIVMNPWMTSPAINENPDYQPVSGNKMLVDFCSIDAANNDYLISPRLNFERDFKISFMARSYKGGSVALERIRVGYSTSGTQPSNFTFVNEGDYVEVPAAWTLYEYTIPKSARYVTINCVSDDAFMLMIDDIFIGTNNIRPGIGTPQKAAATNPLTGFNIYRDGVKINTEPVGEIRYTDTVDEYGDYTYTVSAVYADGTESGQSEALAVEVPDIRLLPFEDDFDDWTLHEDKWSVVNHDGTTMQLWSIDYYVYGLVDPSATYHYSSLSNYNQSLMSRELHTLDRTGTYLRFNLKLKNYMTYNVDYLTVEITSDGGNTWQEVTTFDNTGGSFDWISCQYNIGELLTNDLFHVRFRAHGALATYIDYWYVDDVKIWNPKFGTGSLNVTSADGAIANCPVKLTSDTGAEINATTDADGNIELEQIEEGLYTVSIINDGYNVYSGTWEVEEGKSNTFTVKLTRPVISLSAENISADMVTDDTATEFFTISNTGDGPMAWYLSKTPVNGSGDTGSLWNIQKTFQASGDLQNAVGFDGENYYTTSSVNLGEFWKYDSDGNFIEKFSIPEMYYKLYDITYDGRYFYGSDYMNRLFKLDFVNRRVVDIITVDEEPSLTITHCSYDPDKDGFWIGSWNSLAFIKRDGTITSRLTAFEDSKSLAVYGSAYDNVTPGGPYLWLADEETASDNALDCIQILQYNLNTRKLTGISHTVDDVPGYKMGNSSTGRNYICGITTSSDVKDGTLSLIGILQQSPSLIFSYTLCETDKWLSFTPKHGVLESGAEQKITVGFDSRYAKVGDKLTSSAQLLSNPEIADKGITFTLNATGESSTPRPVSLTATPGEASVTLNWEAGSTTNIPEGYNIYRNNVKVNSAPVADNSYTDRQLTYGQYIYKVTAVYYGDRESIESDSVTAFVKKGAPYYAPLSLTSSVENNRDVKLTWLSPLANADKSANASWSTGEHVDQVGLSSGGYFYAASVWEPTDLIEYRNKTVSSVSVQLVNQCTYLALRISKDGEVIYKKTYTGTILYDGTYTDIPVEEPIVIEPGCTYHFAAQIMNGPNVMPLGMDGSEAVDGKGNALSLNGTEWFPATQSGIDGNFNIRINFEPNPNITEEAPVGYNVYRDGKKVNGQTVADLTYDDAVETAGNHEYTVTSVYADGGESAQGNSTSINIINIDGRYAPNTVNANVHINRNVTLRWDYPTATATTIPTDIETRPVTVDGNCPEYVNTFTGMRAEMGIVSDGKFIYTSVYNENGRINKYSLSGEYLCNFVIDGLEGIRNLAYDGEYFYAADNLNDIKRIDIENQAILETISISEYARHLAFIPEADGGKGGFEVGDWETSIYVSKNGSKIGTGPTLLGAAGTAYYDGKIYAFEQGGTENACSIGIYDYATGKRIGNINLGDYSEITIDDSSLAGGISAITTSDGITLLALAIQTIGNTRFLFIEIDGIAGTKGYNIYRNGEKLNQELLTRRYYAEALMNEGEYDYTVETVYIDGTTSEPSVPAHVTIVPAGEAKTPTDLKAVQSSYGYNVLLSFSDPNMYDGAALAENFDQSSGLNSPLHDIGNWTTTTEYAYDNSMAAKAEKGTEAIMILSADGMKYLRMAVCNADDHNGNGSIDVLYSISGTDKADFITLATYSTTELWREVTVTLPEGTDYVAIRKQSAVAEQFLDAIRLFTEEPTDNVYAYDIFRDGKQINTEPVQNISYLDQNLLPGHYDYQARLTTMTSAVSELTDAVSIDLDYDNGGLAPTNLTAEIQNDGNVQLNWQAPALGSPIYLRWHSGSSYDAAGLPSGGAFFAGTRWLSSDLKGYEQMVLSDVEVYINQVPDALFLLIYEGGTLVRQQYVPSLSQYSFNTIHLNDPLTLNTSKELRVAVYVEHNEITVPLGYDEGPAIEGKGNLYSSDGTTWTTLSDDAVNIDANWNISIGLSPYSETQYPVGTTAANASRKFVPKSNSGSIQLVSAIVSDLTASGKNVLEGYNVYRNNDMLNTGYITETEYLDTKPYTDKYLEYKVSAIYSASGEKFSESVTVTPTIIEAIGTDSDMRIETVEGGLRILNARTGDTVKVYSTAGTTVYNSVIGDSYAHFIFTAAIPAGTYIVKVGTDTFKFAIK